VPLNAYTPPSDQAMSALRRLLDNYAINGGIGSSLINFFRVPGVADQNVARDVILLESLRNGLNLLASSAFAPAFNSSTDLNEYRWGKLHRIVFSHYLGGPFNIPPSGAPAPVNPLGSALPGFPRAGGRGSVDAASHDARADGLNEFMFSSGPARRIVATMNPECPSVLEVIPGGENGAPGSPNGTDQLALWLVNANKPLPVCLSEVNDNAVETVHLVCGNGVVDPGEECDDGNTINSDGCNVACRIVPAITCLAPNVSAGAQTCQAEVACAAIATCVDPRGGTVTTTCTPSGPYALGNTNVTVACGNTLDNSVAECSVTVSDTTPPVVTMTAAPGILWPPNHKMTAVGATVTVVDACDPEPSIVLAAARSSEPDDAPGGGDGHTTDDIQGAATGTADFEILLRAEREGAGSGRTYTLTYQVTDSAGNVATSSAEVLVPHAMSDVVEPLSLVLSGATATRLEWGEVLGALDYDVIRGDLAALRIAGSNVELGTVACIERDSLDANTTGNEDTDLPAPGQVFFYAVQFYDGVQESSYGSESVGRARVVSGGGCR
jgi:cysteine-rich repeat protein